MSIQSRFNDIVFVLYINLFVFVGGSSIIREGRGAV